MNWPKNTLHLVKMYFGLKSPMLTTVEAVIDHLLVFKSWSQALEYANGKLHSYYHWNGSKATWCPFTRRLRQMHAKKFDFQIYFLKWEGKKFVSTIDVWNKVVIRGLRITGMAEITPVPLPPSQWVSLGWGNSPPSSPWPSVPPSRTPPSSRPCVWVTTSGVVQIFVSFTTKRKKGNFKRLAPVLRRS